MTSVPQLHWLGVPWIYCTLVSQTGRGREQLEFAREALESLKAKLLEAREVVMSENPAFLMIGPSFICPDSVITKLCNEAKCINDINDLKGYGIRKELKECFLI